MCNLYNIHLGRNPDENLLIMLGDLFRRFGMRHNGHGDAPRSMVIM